VCWGKRCLCCSQGREHARFELIYYGKHLSPLGTSKISFSGTCPSDWR
jgi:hypothetical protein